MNEKIDYVQKQLLDVLLQGLGKLPQVTLPKMGALLDGGILDPFRLLPVARLMAPSMMLGSAVVIKKRWALTVSHCLPSDPEELSLYTIPKDPRDPAIYTKVAKVYWQDGQSSRVGKHEWNAYAKEYTGLNDQIVLLELEEEIPGFWLGFAELPGNVCPEPDDHVLVAGFGEDRDGNYPTCPQLGFARYLEPRTQWRGAIYRDRHDPYNGMVRKFDSGAPLFLPDFSIMRNWTRLLGLHTTRSAVDAKKGGMPEEGIALFLPLSPAVQAWIRGITKEAPSTGSLRSSATSSSDTFVLRNAHNCLRVRDDNALVNPVAGGRTTAVWVLNVVASVHDIFRKCEAVEIYRESASKPPYMKFINRSGQRGLPILLTRDPTDHWFYGKDEADTEFYVFARSAGTTPDGPCKRIRIEAFIDGSPRVRPGTTNIDDGGTLNLDTEERILCDIDTRVWPANPIGHNGEEPDQDDQSNGYEKPR